MATFAALRLPQDAARALPVKTVAINPLRLGLLCRARIGLDAIKQAAQRVIAVTVDGDWVARWTTLHSAPIGRAYRIPVTEKTGLSDPHNSYVLAAHMYRNNEDTKLPSGPSLEQDGKNSRAALFRPGSAVGGDSESTTLSGRSTSPAGITAGQDGSDDDGEESSVVRLHTAD